MKRFLFLATLFCSLLALPAWALANANSFIPTSDTLLINIDEKGNKSLQHALRQGETLYSVSKFYGLSTTELAHFNPTINSHTNLAINTPLTIPVPNRAILRKLKPGIDSSKYIPLYYKIKKGDTIYGIAKRAFNIAIPLFKTKFNFKDNNIPVGRVLQLGWLRATPFKKEWQNKRCNRLMSKDSTQVFVSKGKARPRRSKLMTYNLKMKHKFKAKIVKKQLFRSKGKAQSQPNNSQLSGLFCLHRYAKKGSIVKIKNNLNQQTAYAKVLGAVPFNNESEVVVVISKDVAKLLGEKEGTTFFVETNYAK